MKIGFPRFVVAAAVATSLSSTLQAQTIVGVQIGETGQQALYGPNPYTSGTANYTAGTPTAGNGGNYYTNNWNSAFSVGGDRSGTNSPLTGSSLRDNLGNTSGITFSLAFMWADNTGNTAHNFPLPDGSNSFPFYQNTGNADYLLANTGVAMNSGPITLSIAGLNATSTYTLIAYVSSLYFAGPTTAQWTVGSQSYFTNPTSGGGLTSWVRGSATTAGTAVASNYVEFDGLTGLTSLNLTGTGVGSGQPAIMGFQIVETATVPEPATYALLFGGLSLLFVTRRFRRVRSA